MVAKIEKNNGTSVGDIKFTNNYENVSNDLAIYKSNADGDVLAQVTTSDTYTHGPNYFVVAVKSDTTVKSTVFTVTSNYDDITITKDTNAKTSYNKGDKFDPSAIAVKAKKASETGEGTKVSYADFDGNYKVVIATNAEEAKTATAVDANTDITEAMLDGTHKVFVVYTNAGSGVKSVAEVGTLGAKKIKSATMAVTMLAGCGNGSKNGTEAADGGTEAAESKVVTNTYGDSKGTHLEMWTFVELHAQHYGTMVEQWNKDHPDKTIEITCTTYPYGDMHTKLLTSLEAGTGAPDICDVEVGQFPNVVAGQDKWLVPLDDYTKDYMSTMVPARMETYQGSDGHYYGAPYHVGATVMYYNVKAMGDAMGLSQADVIAKIDGVKTWDDYEALGTEYVEAAGEKGTKYWTSVDTGGTDWLWLAMAEYGEDWTGGFDGKANVQLDSVKKMLTMQQKWLKSDLAEVSPDGHVDLEAGFQNIMDHNIVSFPKAMWYMSRFTNYMPDEKGNWYIAKCPTFEEGQKCSVGIGGTGTVVTQQSKAKELAAEFLCWAKMSEVGEQNIWDTLGFDVCNTACWTNDTFAHNDENKYNQFFINYPYDVLNSIGMDNIGKISVVKISPTINENVCNTTLNEVLEDPDYSVDDALQELQDAVYMEQEE